MISLIVADPSALVFKVFTCVFLHSQAAERTGGLASLCEHYLKMCENVCNNLQPIFLK